MNEILKNILLVITLAAPFGPASIAVIQTRRICKIQPKVNLHGGTQIL